MFQRSITWFTGFAIWFAVLWWLSSRAPDFPPPLHFTVGDKFLHFGYFFIGAYVLATAFHLTNLKWTPRRLLLTVSLLMALIGAVDEFHQSFVPQRQGNDPFDFAADVLGSISGAMAFLGYRQRLRRPRSKPLEVTPEASVTPPKGIPKSAIACIIISVFLAVVLLTGSAKLFHIPTGGMAPTLQPGDYIFVTRIFRNTGELQAGEIVVFRPPTNRETHFIQRIAATAGDKVETIDGSLAVNGRLLRSPEEILSKPADPRVIGMMPGMRPASYPFVVKPGEVFLLGDNFENSLDSRYFGPVSTDSITHKPHSIIHPLSRAGKLE